ncbi:MAG: diacylglycerol kinase family protein [Flavobacteriales bacterium]|nr:diacylglycerol kinase family protein [Flavobacteriales bacterium]
MSTGPFNLFARLRSFTHAIRGIGVMFSTQHNAWIHLLAIVLVVLLGFYTKLNLHEWIFIALAVGLVLVAELANTAIEFLGDAVSREQNEHIKNAKDIAAGAVLVAAIVAVIIACLIFIPKITTTLGFCTA